MMQRRAAAGLFAIAVSCRALAQTEPAPTVFGGFAQATIVHRATTVFHTGELDLYGRRRLTERWSVLGEVLLLHIHHSTGTDPYGKNFEVNLERLYATYDRSDRLRLEIGQTHTGIIAWNEREHRSRFLQTPIDVPSIARGEEQGGAWPTHFVGVSASGRLPGSSGLTYGCGVGAARGRARDEIQGLVDDLQRPATLVSLRAAPDVLAGLEAGAAYYSGGIPALDGRMRESNVTISTSYVRGGAEIRSEWAEMRHDRATDHRRFVTRGWYALASWRPPGRLQVLRPYVLIDRLRVAGAETYLRDVHDEDTRAVGVRWDVSRRLAIKADVQSQRGETIRGHSARLQIAISF